ncbi:MAG: sensor hybrid histidine kinase [Pedosphaera sp.]|nr:sensor hybrid histidine kinase [Pedosphaera sp.]
MNVPGPKKNSRILVIDDNQAIHADFRKILCGSNRDTQLEAAEAALFGEPATTPENRNDFKIDSAQQGDEALALVEQAMKDNNPYAMAFVDIRMPPGWDGIETTARLWQVDPDLQIVICTAYSDYSWDDMIARIGNTDRMVILKKPFDAVEVLQLAHTLTEKWRLFQESKRKFEDLEKLVAERTWAVQGTNVLLENEIKEHKRAAEALQESENRYALLFRSNPLPMWAYDAETLRFLAVNETAIRHYGYSQEEFLSMTIRDLHPGVEASVSDAMAKSQLQLMEYGVLKHRKKDGSTIDVEIITRQLQLFGRNAKLVLAMDVTQRKLAEDRVREQAVLLNLASDAIFVRDLEDRIHFWNQGAERLYGWTAEEAMNGGLAQSFFKDFFQLTAAQEALLGKGEWSGEMQRSTKSGEKVVVNSRWTLLRDAQGKPRSILTIDSDISEKKKLETQFLRTQRMEAIGTLATGMAHDLNNILAPVMMATEILRWPLPAKEFEETLSRIEISAKRGAEIIKQVLTFGRGANGERVLLQPRQILEEMVTMIRQTFPKTIEITSKSPPDLWNIQGDRTQIQQVLLNLCVNARDAMVQGGSLSLRAENIILDEHHARNNPDAKPGSHVLIQVSDSGAGIPAEIIDRVFDPFFTTKSQGKGTGLGLSTVMGIVKGHGGSVTVCSEPNKGTVFNVFLPAFPDTKAISAPTETLASPLPHGTGDTILLVDDEIAILKANQKILEKYHYQVLTAQDGAEGLAVFAHHRKVIKAIVTDIMMPHVDGLALVRAVRKLDKRVPIIASSGLGKSLGRNEACAELDPANVNKFLTKPYTAEALLVALKEVLQPELQPA